MFSAQIFALVPIIAVMFTFSFGTAMAASTSELIASKAAAEKADLADAVDTALRTIVYNQDGYVVTPVYTNSGMVSKAAVDQLGAKIKTDYTAKIELEAKNQTIADTFNSAALEAVWEDVDSTSEILDVIFDADCAAALVAQYPIEKAAALAEVAKVIPAEYNANDYTADGVANSDKDLVAKAVATAQDTINAITAPGAGASATVAKAAIDDTKAAVSTLKSAISAYVKLAEQEKTLADAKDVATNAIDAQAETLKGTLTTTYEGIINGGGTPSAIANAKAKLAALDSNIAAVVSKYNAIIAAVAIDADNELSDAQTAVNNAKTAALGALTDETSLENAIAAMGDTDALIAYAQSYAASMKVMVNADGTVKYNAATVDKALVEAIKRINAGTDTTTSQVKTYLDATTDAAGEASALAAYKTTKKGELDSAYPAANYNAEEKTVVADLLKAAKKAIDDAVDTDAVDAAVKAAKAELDAVLTSLEVTALEGKVTTALSTFDYTDAGKLGTGKALEGYFDSMAAKNPDKDYSAAKAGTLAAAAKVFYDAVLAKNDADLTQTQVNEIVKGQYFAALAVIDAAKTSEEIKADAAAVVEAINKIPATVDLSAKDIVFAAKAAYDAYDETPGKNLALITNASTLTAAETKLVAAAKKDANDQVSALSKKVILGTLTVEDAAAVEAARAAVDAFNADYKDLTTFSGISETAIEAVEEELEKLNFKDAANKINALPEVITDADADAVKAAEEAYNKLTDTQKNSMNPLLVAKLESAKKQLTVLEDPIKAVESLKIKASTKAYKGYIRLKWTVSGDAEAADGFQIYRSTKSSSAGKKIYTTKKATTRSFKNTSVKKGTKYYYKVRAFKVVDGVTYYSDWSSRGIRTAK